MDRKITLGELLQSSWTALRGKWGVCILTCLVCFGIWIAVGYIPYLNGILSILLAPLNVGLLWFFLKIARNETVGVGNLFDGFQNYGKILWGCFRPGIFIFLWSLLLIIPGIIAAYRYMLTMFVLKDYPELSVKEAMAKSSELMAGNKLRIFGYTLVFSLIVSCLGILTLGIGYIWLIPWVNSFFAHFYLAVLREKGESVACEVL